MSSQLKKKKRMVILVHFLRAEDYKKYISFAKFIPPSVGEHLFGLKKFWVMQNFSIKKEVEGWLISLFQTAKKLLLLPREVARKKILEALLYAQEKLNAEFGVIGAFLPSLTQNGEWLVKRKELKMYINTGRALTVWVLLENLKKIQQELGFDLKEKNLAIVGAGGNIGSALSKLLEKKARKLFLIERKKERIENLKKEIKNAYFSQNIEDVKEADIIITTTSHPDVLLKSEFLKKGAIIIDNSEPSNVSEDLVKQRKDIFVIDGARVSTKSIGFNLEEFNKVGCLPYTCYACITEGILQALEGEKKNFVGKVDFEHLSEVKRWANKYKIIPAPFSFAGKEISLENYKKVFHE